MRSARIRRWALIVAVQLVIVVALLEVGLRIALPHSDGLRALMYLPTVSTEYDEIDTTEALLATSAEGFAPGKEFEGFLRNSRGFRTPEYRFARRPGVPRVVVMGDSFASDSGRVPWRSMWPTLLGSHLQAALEREVEVINLGVPAVGPRFVLRLWELEGRRLDPDLVVFSFFVGNDFTDEFAEPLTALDANALARVSYAFRLARNGWRMWQERHLWRSEPADEPAPGGPRMGVEIGEQVEPPGPYFSEDTYLRVQRFRIGICGKDGDYFEKRFDALTPILERFDASVRLAGASLAVLIIPDEFQVDPRQPAMLGIDPSRIDLEMPQRRLTEFLTEHDVAHLDLLPVMREANRRGPVYRERDTHWNSEGNRIAARELARFLTGSALVP